MTAGAAPPAKMIKNKGKFRSRERRKGDTGQAITPGAVNIRVAIAFDNFGPYHVARLAGAARHMDVLAVETAATSGQYDWDSPDIPSGLDRAILFDAEADVSRARLGATIDSTLSPFSPDAVAIPGWSTATSLAIAAWAAAHGVPVIAMSESNGWDFGRNPAREFLKRRIAEYFTAGLCTSDGQAEYLRALGLAPQAVFRGYNAVDNGYFAREAARRGTRQCPRVSTARCPKQHEAAISSPRVAS